MVEKYGVKAFAIEGDYGGCEKVNQYILGGDGSADEIAKAIVARKITNNKIETTTD